jgi:hypothetical protein
MNNIYLTFFLILISTGFSQENKLKGKLTDKNEKALPFVNIGIPMKHIGTVSNENGDYILKTPSNILEIDAVVFSYIGYKTIKKSVAELKDQKGISIQMETEENQLDEVVFETKKLLFNPSSYNEPVAAFLSGNLESAVLSNNFC